MITGKTEARAKYRTNDQRIPGTKSERDEHGKEEHGEEWQKFSANINPSRNAPRYPLSPSRAGMPDVNPENQFPPGSRSKWKISSR